MYVMMKRQAGHSCYSPLLPQINNGTDAVDISDDILYNLEASTSASAGNATLSGGGLVEVREGFHSLQKIKYTTCIRSAVFIEDS